MENPNAVQPCDMAITDTPQYDTFEEWLIAAIAFADNKIKDCEPGSTDNLSWSIEWQILTVAYRRAELYGVFEASGDGEDVV